MIRLICCVVFIFISSSAYSADPLSVLEGVERKVFFSELFVEDDVISVVSDYDQAFFDKCGFYLRLIQLQDALRGGGDPSFNVALKSFRSNSLVMYGAALRRVRCDA